MALTTVTCMAFPAVAPLPEAHREANGGWIGPAGAFVVVLGFVAPWAAPLAMWVLIGSVVPWLVAKVFRVRPTTRAALTTFGVTAALLVGPVRDTVTPTGTGMWERKLYSLGSEALGAVTGLSSQLTLGHHVVGFALAAAVAALASPDHQRAPGGHPSLLMRRGTWRACSGRGAVAS